MKSDLLYQVRSGLEDELSSVIQNGSNTTYKQYKDFLNYPMGLKKDRNSTAKRVRPFLLVLSYLVFCDSWKRVLPAAAALEFMHNFSLVHDDIQDKSILRRGEETVWVTWGDAQAINIGDALLACSNIAMERLVPEFTFDVYYKTSKILSDSFKRLTQGQYLDISFESRNDVSVLEYIEMTEGKTGALLSAAFEIGALLGGATDEECKIFRKSGLKLGMAYQIQDDWLGIWGDILLTGKSTESDLVNKKKTYPILMALEESASFKKEWVVNETISAEKVPDLVKMIEKAGIKQKKS